MGNSSPGLSFAVGTRGVAEAQGVGLGDGDGGCRLTAPGQDVEDHVA